MKSESIKFNGITFRRYPESERRSDRVYFTPGAWDKARGVGRLHEEIWKAANGPIPEGHHIHHLDHDPLNNDLSNLACLSEAEHHSHHGNAEDGQTRLHSPEHMAHLDSIRGAAAEWHSTPEGIEWHREHGRKVMAERPLLSGTCEQCGNAFLSKMPLRFCSNSCKTAWRRASGLDDETRQCARCGADFTVNKYARKNYCSRSCASKAARSRAT
jgi:endogenous inhibitor of DNA gyrase (YacG/DUF329 family)